MPAKPLNGLLKCLTIVATCLFASCANEAEDLHSGLDIGKGTFALPIDSIVLALDESTPHQLMSMRIVEHKGQDYFVFVNPHNRKFYAYNLASPQQQPFVIGLTSDGVNGIPKLSEQFAVPMLDGFMFLSFNQPYVYMVDSTGKLLHKHNVEAIFDMQDPQNASHMEISGARNNMPVWQNKAVIVPCTPNSRMAYKGPVNSLRQFVMAGDSVRGMAFHPFPERFEKGIFGLAQCFVPLQTMLDSNRLLAGFAISDSFHMYDLSSGKAVGKKLLRSSYFVADDIEPVMRPEEFAPNQAVKQQLIYGDWLRPMHYKLVCNPANGKMYLPSNIKPPDLEMVKAPGGDFREGAIYSIAVFNKQFDWESEWLFDIEKYQATTVELVQQKIAMIPRTKYQPYEDSLVIHLFDL